ncbi:hypothetical protein FSST1_002368 [Fusarium sambucinum]
MGAPSQPPPSTFGGGNDNIWSNYALPSQGMMISFVYPVKGGHECLLPTPDNADRSNVPYPSWPATSNSPSHSSSPNNRTSGADTNDTDFANSFRGMRTSDNLTNFPRHHAVRNSQDSRNSNSFGFSSGLTGGSTSRQEPSYGASHTPSSSIHSQPAMRYTQQLNQQTQGLNQQQVQALSQQQVQALSQQQVQALNQQVQALSQQAMNPQQAQALNMQAFSLNNAHVLDQQPAHHLYPHPTSRTTSSQLNPASQTWNQNFATNHASRNSLSISADLSSGPFLDDQLATTARMDQGSANTFIQNTWNMRESGSQPLENQSNRRMSSQSQYSTFSRPYGTQNAPYGTYNGAGFIQSMVSAAIPPLFQGNSFGNAANAQRNHNPSGTIRHPWCIHLSSIITTSKYVPIDAVFGWVVIAAGDNEISRFIQLKLTTAKSDEKEKMFLEIGPDMLGLMKDLYGNYVCQKLIEHGSMNQKMSVVETVKGHIVELSLNAFGCRVFQKIVECCPVSHIASILDEIYSYDVLKQVMQSEPGNHVIQKLVQTMPPKDVKFITVACQENARELSEDQYSCRILQRVLEYAEEDDKKKLVAKLSLMMDELVTHQWGNYVAGHIIQNRGPEDRDPIYEHVMSRLLTLCQHKLASHVVEKCIVYGTDEQRTRILERLCPANDSEQTFENMFKNQFGNYVVASLLKHLKWGTVERAQFKENIIVQYDLLKATGRSFEKLDKIFEEDKKMEAKEAKLASNLQVEVDSAGPTPVLTNETNSPQSDSLPSADASTIEDPHTNKKNTGANPRVRDDDDA